MTLSPITGVNIENTTVHGNLTISGVTIQLLRELPPLWANVPPLPNHFLGRDDLVDDLVQRLIAGHSPALSAEGLPGVGKTTLAVVLAYHPAILAHFADGVLWAGLGPTPDVPSQLAAWAAALGIDVSDQPTAAARAQVVRNTIGQRRLLLVIDDAWHADAAGLMRCGGPRCSHLLTTRDQALARQFAGTGQAVSVPTLADDPAFALLQALAPEACTVDPETAHTLARTVDGLPLALELLGGYLAAPERSYFSELSQTALAELANPDRRLALAARRLGAHDGAEITLHATIALSLEGLPAEAAAAFHALGAFAPKPATFNLDAAKAVTGVDAAALALLAARNLLARGEREASRTKPEGAHRLEGAKPGVDGERLALHQVLADVARTRLELDSIERHRDHYLAQVDEDREDWQRIQMVYPQVQQALAWQISHQPDDSRLLDFYRFLRIFQVRQGLWGDYAYLAGLCLTWTQRHQDHRHEATFLNDLGYMHNVLGDKQQALDYFNQALPITRQVGDQAGEAGTLNNIGGVYSALGGKQQALAYYHQALPIMRQVSDQAGEAATLNNIGRVYSALGDKQQALDYYHQALPIRRQMGDRAGEAAALNNIGLVYRSLGDMQQALGYYNQALPLHLQVGYRAGEATTLNNIGEVYRSLGDVKQALDYYDQALSIMRQVGDRAGEAVTLNNIGLVYDALGDKQQALDYYRQALPMHRQVGNRAMEAATLTNIGGVYGALGDKQQAIDFFNQALPIMRQVGDRTGAAQTLTNIGTVYDDLGDKQKALDYFNQALPIRLQVGDQAGEAVTLNNIGLVYSDLGDKQQALDYYHQALPLSRKVGDRAGEAATLNNIGLVYSDLGDMQQALDSYNQALLLNRKVGDRAGEAATLNNLAHIYFQQGQLDRTVQMLRGAIQAVQDIGAVAEEAAGRCNLAVVLHQALGQTREAIEQVSRAIAILQRYHLPQDAGGATLAQHLAFLQQLQAALPSGWPTPT